MLSARAYDGYPDSAGDCAEWRRVCAGGYAVRRLALLTHGHAGDAHHGRVHVRETALHVCVHVHGVR